jgi:uncharacterized protein YegP (UPF0339 family)
MKLWKLELFRSKNGWRLRIRASNGRIIMSSEAYSSCKKAWKTAMRLLAMELVVIEKARPAMRTRRGRMSPLRVRPSDSPAARGHGGGGACR